ncbi:hypothetical protein OJAV_G00003600 [Oryzias javanicus]|uniref:Ig-like domain-containing protein n=1 Tax=Oryzias javanicus TaxID=123683 RepID=A0A3S2Q1E1_ORYJA|nr:hypothetical protein OJAV_G00003600 [Oryzias javanicus]
MSASSAFFTVFLLVSLRISEVNSCGSDQKCPDKPVFTPSSLVVKHGDPASTTCVACQSGCDEENSDLERSSGTIEKNGRTIMWNVSSLTEWDTNLICFYSHQNETQCCSTLSVTVYQMPVDVSLHVWNHSGPMLENRLYTLVCNVQDVAPIGKLIVTFYRGQTQLGQPQFSSRIEKKPMNVTFLLRFNASKEADGAQLSCVATLELGPEGPQHLSVVKSSNFTATVHYGPELQDAVKQISIYEGETLHLNCSSGGNPDPSYTWILPFTVTDAPNTSSVLTFESVDSQHKGQYNCTISNSVKTVSMIFEVDVQVNFLPYIIVAAVVIAAVVLIILAVQMYHCYKHKYMRDYNLKDVFRLRRQHSQGAY